MVVTNIVPIYKCTTTIQKFIKKKIDYITGNLVKLDIYFGKISFEKKLNIYLFIISKISIIWFLILFHIINNFYIFAIENFKYTCN